jgi:hypothetical protein
MVSLEDLDPLGMDNWYRTECRGPLIHRTSREIREELERVIPTGFILDTPEDAVTALRDLDPPLCVIECREPGSYRSIAGLEDLLIYLGDICDHIPRGDNYTYGEINPLDDRMRTITGLDAERILIEGLRAGGVGLETILRGLETIATTDDEYEACEAAGSLAAAWHPMVESAKRMAREMPLDVFSRDLIPWLVPIEIGGKVYRAPTGAQFSISDIDYALWGRSIATSDPVYQEYTKAFMAESPTHHRQMVERILFATNGMSIISALHARLKHWSPDAVIVVTDGLIRLLKLIIDFRKIHTRFAITTLEMRPGDKGSGMQNELQFVPLLNYTRLALRCVELIQNDLRKKAKGGLNG